MKISEEESTSLDNTNQWHPGAFLSLAPSKLNTAVIKIDTGEVETLHPENNQHQQLRTNRGVTTVREATEEHDQSGGQS